MVSPRTEVDDLTLARILRCDEMSIRKNVRAGIIHRQPNRKFAMFAAIGAVVEHLRQVAGRYGTGDAMKAGAKLKDAQRRLAEIKARKLASELIDGKIVQAEWVSCMVRLRAALLAVPSRVQQILPQLSIADIAVLDREIRAALEALADDHQEVTESVGYSGSLDVAPFTG